MRCSDASSNANASDYAISFSVAAAASTGGGGNSGGAGGGGTGGGGPAIIYGTSSASATAVAAVSSAGPTVQCLPGEIFSTKNGKRCTSWSTSGTSGATTVAFASDALTSNVTAPTSLTRNLTIGSSGSDVKSLQQFLNANGFKAAASGAGSPGLESTYFGPATKAALARYQASVGIAPAAGYFGALTRARIGGAAVTPATPAVPAVAGISPAIPAVPASPALKLGSTGPLVKLLRQKLRAAGYLAAYGSASDVPASAAAETDNYGTVTESAVKKFQCDKAIVCSGTAASTGWGSAGAKTRAALGM